MSALTYSQSSDLLRVLHLLKWASRCNGSCEMCLLFGTPDNEKCACAISEAGDN